MKLEIERKKKHVQQHYLLLSHMVLHTLVLLKQTTDYRQFDDFFPDQRHFI